MVVLNHKVRKEEYTWHSAQIVDINWLTEPNIALNVANQMTLEEYRNSLRPSDRPLFDDVIDIGIRKTVDALLDANVDDESIQRVVIAHWCISQDVYLQILIDEKKEAAIYFLRQHLAFQGYTSSQTDAFLSSYGVKIHLSHNHELLNCWNKPEKMIKILYSINNGKGK